MKNVTESFGEDAHHDLSLLAILRTFQTLPQEPNTISSLAHFPLT
jgi:hypothetical protein